MIPGAGFLAAAVAAVAIAAAACEEPSEPSEVRTEASPAPQVTTVAASPSCVTRTGVTLCSKEGDFQFDIKNNELTIYRNDGAGRRVVTVFERHPLTMDYRVPVSETVFSETAAVEIRQPTQLSIADAQAQQRNTQPAVFDHAGLPLLKIHAETLSAANTLGKPSFLALNGSRLWISDRGGNPFLHIVDTATGRIIRSHGRRGDGPEEFRDVVNLLPDPVDQSKVLAWDARYRLMRVSETRGVEAGYISPQNQRPAYVFPAGRNQFLGFRYSDSSAFVLFDAAGRILRTASMTLPGDSAVVRRQRQLAITGAFICTKTDFSGFALVHSNFGRIELFDSLARKVGNARVPYPSEPTFEKNATTQQAAFKQLRSFYQGCAFSDQYLFALFLGKSLNESSPSVTGGRYVHVFDYSGALVRVLELDAEISILTVDRAGRKLYGTSWTEALLFKATIPTLTR